MKIILSGLLLALAFTACSKGDDYIVKNDSEQITINSFIGNPDSRSRDTVVSTTDTIYLNGYAEASNGLILKSYFWDDDNGHSRKEYQFKVTYPVPGIYRPVFFIVDNLGDTLTDTLQITACQKPQIDLHSFTPQTNAKKLPVDSVYFVWNAITENNLYQFKLFCDDSTIIDTLLSQHYFKPNQILPELSLCNWNVKATNAYNIPGDSLQSSFMTSSKQGLGRITGQVIITDNLFKHVLLTLGNSKRNDTLAIDNGFFDTGKIPAGKYTLKALVQGFPDFSYDSVNVYLNEGFIEQRSILLKDSKRPELPSLGDTIPYARAYVFPIENGGSPLSPLAASATLDGASIQSLITNDTLYIQLPENNVPVCKILKIKITDSANNTNNKSSYVCPQQVWAKIPTDTTIALGDSLKLYYEDHNPYNLKIKQIQWYTKDPGNSWFIKKGPASNQNAYYLYSSIIGSGTHTIVEKTTYWNGLETTSYFILEVTE